MKYTRSEILVTKSIGFQPLTSENSTEISWDVYKF